VLDLRFGFDGSAPRTFEEMARELQTSTSRATADWYAAMRAMMHAAIHAMM
jgi:DNA-directed RNA polymerase sigma subunit (sigma70/sigma32)